MLSLHIDMTHVVEIFPKVRPTYSPSDMRTVKISNVNFTQKIFYKDCVLWQILELNTHALDGSMLTNHQ